MSKILRDNELKQFIKEFDIKYYEEIFSIIICIDEGTPRFIINGEKTIEFDKLLLEKYL